MKNKEINQIIFLCVLITILSITSCKKNQQGRNNACIEPDKYTAAVNDLITVSNCGDALPSEVTITLDWGDGTAATSGGTGTHKYTKIGTFKIKLMANGSPASEKIGSSEKIERVITIN